MRPAAVDHKAQRSKQIPSKHAGSDREAFWLRPVMAITASMQPEKARIVYGRSDFPHPFQLRFSAMVRKRDKSDRDGNNLVYLY